MYEFQEFTWTPPANQYIVNDTTPFGMARAGERWWQQGQQPILSALQGWLDEGWEPTTAPSPDCFEISVHREPMIKSRRGWVLFALFTLLGLGIPLILYLIFGFNHETHYASAFRLQLQRSLSPSVQASDTPTPTAQ